MTVAWPSFLPLPARQGHSYQDQDLVVRSSMEGGPTRLRKKFSNGPKQFSIGFVLRNRQQWAMFEAYHYYDLNQGANEFFLPVNTGAGLLQYRAIMLDVPKYDASIGPNLCSVTVQVQILDNTVISADLYQILKDTPNFLPAEDALDIVTNISYPEALT